MKDIEKAKEIADKNGKLKLYWQGVELDGIHYDASPECYNSAMEMAEWKDEQLLEELSKLSLSLNSHNYMMWVLHKINELSEQLKNNSNEK